MFKFSQQHITVFRNKRYFELSMLIAYFLEKASIAHNLKMVNEDKINNPSQEFELLVEANHVLIVAWALILLMGLEGEIQ